MVDLENLDKYYIDDYIKDIFIGFYQQLFNQNRGEFFYDIEDKDRSTIDISDHFSIQDLTPEFKPTIYIRRRPFSFMGTSIDQMMSKSLMTGDQRSTDLIAGSIEVVAVAREGLEASRLAGIIFLVTNAFKDQFRKRGVFDMSVKTIGDEVPKDIRSSMRVVEVPVLIQLSFQYSWMLTSTTGVPLSGITAGRSTETVSGNKLTGIPATGCNDGTGVDVGDGDDGETKICIPITSESPNKD